MYGNLLTLPIGDDGLLYVEPLYVRGGSGENAFPLLQKVLVNYADRIGYANTLSEALDQVFGAGARPDGDRQRGHDVDASGDDHHAHADADARRPRRVRRPAGEPWRTRR